MFVPDVENMSDEDLLELMHDSATDYYEYVYHWENTGLKSYLFKLNWVEQDYQVARYEILKRMENKQDGEQE